MADKGGSGIELNLDHVPCREKGMTPYEMMLSESQERMLMVLKPGREKEAEKIFKKWELDFAVIGITTDTKRLVLKFKGETVADIPVTALADEAPLYERPWEEPKRPAPLGPVAEPKSITEALAKLVATPDLASRRWIYEQYDSTVMADTVQKPSGDAAIVRIHNTQKAVALTTDVTPRYVQADPYIGGVQAVAECWRNITAVGGTPLAITDNLNFGNPQRPEIMGQFVLAVRGIGDACRALDFPVVSGNVSLYNETNGQGILPTPAIGGVGILKDVTKHATIPFKAAGETIIVVGETKGHLGQSIYLRDILGREEGAPPPVDLKIERRNGDFVRELITTGRVTAVHDCSDGGLAVAIAEMAMSSGIGATLATPAIGGVGILKDVHKHATIPFKAAGETIIVIGETKGHLGQSIYLREILGREEGAPPPVDLKIERRNGDFVRELITSGRVTAVHDASDGGLAVTIAEMAMSSGLGATLTTPQTQSRTAFWFGEDQARYVVTAKPAEADKIAADAKAAGIPVTKLGSTATDHLKLDGEDPFPTARLRQLNEGWLPKLMAAS